MSIKAHIFAPVSKNIFQYFKCEFGLHQNHLELKYSKSINIMKLVNYVNKFQFNKLKNINISCFFCSFCGKQTKIKTFSAEIRPLKLQWIGLNSFGVNPGSVSLKLTLYLVGGVSFVLKQKLFITSTLITHWPSLTSASRKKIFSQFQDFTANIFLKILILNFKIK